MLFTKPCPGCDHTLPRGHALELRNRLVYRCARCGSYYRWSARPAIYLALAIEAPLLVLLAILGLAGRWPDFVLLLGASLLILVLISIVAVRPVAAAHPRTAPAGQQAQQPQNAQDRGAVADPPAR